MKLLGKIKIHEIAKEIGLTSKEVIAKANELGIEVASHMSSVEEEVAAKIKNSFQKVSKGSNQKQESKKETSKKETAKKETSKKAEKAGTTPVIIRREVILADEEDEKGAKKEKAQTSRHDVGFVERKKNR